MGPASGTAQLAQALVQPGDYLLVNDNTGPTGTGVVHFIGNQSTDTSPPGGPVWVNTTDGSTWVKLQYSSVTSTGAAAYDWSVIRQPRLLQGEEVKSLPADLVIDFNPNPSNSGIPYSINVPQRTLNYWYDVTNTPPTQYSITQYYEIMFSPSGGVAGQGTGGAKIILWVRDNSQVNAPGPPTLIVINPRTGFIGAYDVAPGADPYLFTEDARSGGL
jgi:hypothetical protein